MLENKFCRVPFENLEISTERADGSVPCHTCCWNWLPEVAGDLKKSELKDVWNSQKMQDIRASILDGSFKYCSREFCPEIQSQSLPLKAKVTEPRLRAIIDQQKVVLEDAPRRINMAMDESCNLACPSCRPQQIMNSKEKQEEILELYRKTVGSVIDDIDMIFCCSSGDPFASKVYRTFLGEVSVEKNPQLKIQINTNGVLFDQKAWQSIQNIQRNISQVLISIDAATESTYNIVRKGGDFKRLLENIKFLVGLKRQGYLPYIRLDFVVQQRNFREIPQFIHLGKELGVDHVYFQKINDWGTFPQGEFKKHAIYEPDHPEYHDFLAILEGKETFDPIVKPGNMAELLPAENIRELKKTVVLNELESSAEKVTADSVDEFWLSFHQRTSSDSGLVGFHNFELSSLTDLDVFFKGLANELQAGDHVSVLEYWDGPLNRLLNKSQHQFVFNKEEDLWRSPRQWKPVNKSFAYLLVKEVEKKYPSLKIEGLKFIMPCEFLVKQKGLAALILPAKLVDFLLKPLSPWLALHCHFLISKRS